MIEFASCAYWKDALVGIVLTYMVGTANAAIWSENGHEYQLVSLPGASWDQANANAKATLGPDWYLATITSQREQDFVVTNLLSKFGSDNHEYWLGGFQNPPNEPVANAGWTWITGEPWLYTDWSAGEPNDGGGAGSEQHLGIWGGSRTGLLPHHTAGMMRDTRCT